MWRNWSLRMLLVGMEEGADTLEQQFGRSSDLNGSYHVTQQFHHEVYSQERFTSTQKHVPERPWRHCS